MSNQAALIKSAREALNNLLTKQAFTPMDPAAGGAPPMDPAAAGGMPPGAPPAGAPPGAPMDPAAAGGMPPPADPAAMGGQPVMLTMNDLMQFAQILQGGGAAPAPGGAAPGAPAGAPGGAPNEAGKPKGGKNNTAAVEEKIDRLTSAVMELIAFMTGAQTAMEPEGEAAAGAPPDVGMQPPAAIGQGVPETAMPAPEVPGAPPGMEVQASFKIHTPNRAKMLSSIISNLRKN